MMITVSLKSENVIAFQFDTTLMLNDDVIKRVKELSPPDKSGGSLFEEIQEINTEKYESFASVGRTKKNNGKYEVTIAVTPSRRRQIKERASVSQLIEILSTIKEKLDFDCRILLRLRRSKGLNPIINLPLRLSESVDLAFNEIHGIHLVKKNNEGDIIYHVILDTAPKSALRESISFIHSGNFSETIIDEILKEALKISKLFVVRK